jgi:hypothetical protein
LEFKASALTVAKLRWADDRKSDIFLEGWSFLVNSNQHSGGKAQNSSTPPQKN